MNTQAFRAIVAVAVMVGLVMPYAGVAAADLVGGGEVTNNPPEVVSLTVTDYPGAGTDSNYQTSDGDATTILNDDGDDYIEVDVVVYDPNGEDDLEWINISITTGQTLEDGTTWMTHEITSTDRSNDTSPGYNENQIAGYDNGTADNGYLTFTFKHTYDHGDDPANGAFASSSYTWQAEIKDSTGNTDTGQSSSHSVYNYADLTLEQGYYDSTGTNQTGGDTIWGNWSGNAGTTQEGTTYLYVTSTESTATGNLSIEWTDEDLNNASSGGTIGVTNLTYYEGEAADPGSVTSWGTVPANDTYEKAWVTVTQDTTSTIESWTNYTISIPDGTPVGRYTETFTWTPT